MSQSAETRWQRQLLFAGFWLLALLLLYASPPAPGETVRIIDSRFPAVLEPDGSWAVPVQTLPAIHCKLDWPFWLFGASAGLLLAFVGRDMLRREFPLAIVVLALMGLALVFRPEHFVLGGVLILFLLILDRVHSMPGKLLFAIVCFLVGLVVTREFGFVLLFLALLLAVDFWRESSRNLRIATLAGCAILVAVSVGFPAFRATLLRPLSWLWMPRIPQLFPQDPFAFSTGRDWQGPALLLLFFLACWFGLFWNANRRVAYLLPLLFLSLLGFGNATYLGVSGLALALTYPVEKRSELPLRIGYAVLGLCLVFAFVKFLPQAGRHLDYALGTPTPRRIDPSEWGLEGRVLLLNLDQSHDWQTADLQERFDLLIDDRREIFHDQYPHYAAVCRDLREVRADSYLRSDLEWGGYKRWLKEWSPNVLVADSSSIWDVRRLSLSPHWRVLGIDAERTIFGSTSDPKNRRQAARALGMIQQLEWPALGSGAWHENTLVASTPEESLQVAGVLCAMRFPYAALRVLPESDRSAVDVQRMWCHLEIAHRVRRHAGEPSLLDQYRGVRELRRHLSGKAVPKDEILKAIRSVAGLDLNELAAEWSEQQLASDLDEDERRRFTAALEDAHRPIQVASAAPPGDLETQVRQAILAGDEQAASTLMPDLPATLKRYYGVFVESADQAPTNVRGKLIEALKHPGMPDRLKGEALFYSGCLALETGDSQAAVSDFRQSAMEAPNSPFAALRQLYLARLGG